jgi:hypothetical protein
MIRVINNEKRDEPEALRDRNLLLWILHCEKPSGLGTLPGSKTFIRGIALQTPFEIIQICVDEML